MLPVRREREDRQRAGRIAVLVANLPREARAHVLGDEHQVVHGGRGLGDGFDDGAEIADRDALFEQVLQHALHAGPRDMRGRDIVEQRLRILRQVLQELLHLGEGEQFAHVLLDHFGEVRRQHGRGIDDGVAAEARFFARAFVDPLRIEAEGRLFHRFARQRDARAVGSIASKRAHFQLAFAGIHFADADGVGVRRAAARCRGCARSASRSRSLAPASCAAP